MKTRWFGIALLLWFLIDNQAMLARDDSPEKNATNPLRQVPSNAIAVLHCPHPQRALNQLLTYIRQLELEKFDEVKELLQSTAYQRLERFLTYLEGRYKRTWSKMLEDLSGHGVTLAVIPSAEKGKQAQVIALISASDIPLLKQVYHDSLEILGQELQAAESPVALITKSYRNNNILSAGEQLFLTQQGSMVLLSNNFKVITSALDQLLDSNKPSLFQHPGFVSSEQPQDTDTLIWGWVDLKYLKAQAGDEIEKFKLPTNDLIPHLLFGGLLDAVIRSDHAWLAIRHQEKGPVLEITSPVGRSSSHESARALHMHDPQIESIFPLLNPPGTLASFSFYWNLSSLWMERTRIYKEGALKDFEEGDKKIKPFMAGNSLGTLLNALGTRHRIVIASQRQTPYQFKTKVVHPAFALVAECKDAEQFYKIINIPLRTAGFFLSTQVNMKLSDVSYEGCKITTYRFVENEKNKAYDHGSLFNYSPSFARVGKFFIISSTMELCKNLVDELNRPVVPTSQVDPVDMRHRFSWSALGQAFATERPRLTTELTLRHGGNADRVDEQITALLKLLDRLGSLDLTVQHSPGFKIELRANYR